MATQLTESTFLFDFNVEYNRQTDKTPMWIYSYKIGQVQIKAPSYQVAFILAENFATEIYDVHVKNYPNKAHPDNEYRVTAHLGTFTVNDITMHKFGEV